MIVFRKWHRIKQKIFLLFPISLLIVAFGQPDSNIFLAFLSSAVGLACFWIALFSLSSKKKQFVVSTLWFGFVQAIQLGWLATPEYQGPLIMLVYGGLILLLGLQFGIFTLFFPKHFPCRYSTLLYLSALWTLLEWSRLFFLCGFVWNPIGLALSAWVLPAQFISLSGIFGLSFWVILVNLCAINAYSSFKNKDFVFKRSVIFFLFFLVPYVFGAIHLSYHTLQRSKQTKLLNVALVQTALLPDQKMPFLDRKHRFIHPFDQWKLILTDLTKASLEKTHLIVLPEAALPFGAHSFIYPFDQVQTALEKEWGYPLSFDLPDLLDAHLVKAIQIDGRSQLFASNLFWAQALADHYQSDVILGLDDADRDNHSYYNAAFHLVPGKIKTCRYEKRILLPLAEYLPFSFLKPLATCYGIQGFFSHGKQAKVFHGICPLAISICYEECFSHLMREARLKGAKLLVNVTNDAWYPFSRLPKQHFVHGRLRALENGAPLLRSCNTGVTAAVDSLGHVIDRFGGERNFQMQRGVLMTSLNLYSYQTLYTWVGNCLVIGLSCFFVIWGGMIRGGVRELL